MFVVRIMSTYGEEAGPVHQFSSSSSFTSWVSTIPLLCW